MYYFIIPHPQINLNTLSFLVFCDYSNGSWTYKNEDNDIPVPSESQIWKVSDPLHQLTIKFYCLGVPICPSGIKSYPVNNRKLVYIKKVMASPVKRFMTIPII